MVQIAVDFFNNNFTTETGTTENNIPSLDGIDKEGTVSTFRSLNYSSSSPCNSGIITISDITIATATTTDIGHTALKGVEKEVGRYNRAYGVHCNRRLPYVKRFLNRIIC